MIKSADDAKMHMIAFNPNNEDIPINLTEMTPQELEVNGITHFKSSDIVMDSDGNVRRNKIDMKNSERLVEALEKMYDKKNSPSADDQSSKLNKGLPTNITYDDRRS